MKTVDLDNVTSKAIRTQCEAEMGESLEEFKSFIDKEILLPNSNQALHFELQE